MRYGAPPNTIALTGLVADLVNEQFDAPAERVPSNG
jgi:hypothetical protein